MKLLLSVDNASGEPAPPTAQMRRWVKAALAAEGRDRAELCIRIVDEDEGRNLNRNYRQRDYATNVLSFAADLDPALGLSLLGDLALCAPVVAREASAQGKTSVAHWAHLVVHGTLHLLGYDHIGEAEAEQMEALETRIITGLGFAPPYETAEIETGPGPKAADTRT